MSEKITQNERNALMIATFAIGLSIGIFVGFILAGMNTSLLLSKIPDPDLYFNQTYIPYNNNTNGDPIPSEWETVTHFGFYDNGDNNGGEGYTGLFNPSGNIWYMRWHTVAIRELGVEPGTLLVHFGYTDTFGVLHNDTKTIVFAISEAQENLEFLISVTETTKEEIEYHTAYIILLGEK